MSSSFELKGQQCYAEIRSCTNISEALQARTGLNDNQIQEQQEASAQLEAKRKQMEERIRQAGTTKQQLQDQLLQLQTEELQLKNEEVQAKTENLEAKSALQKAEGEKAQLNNEISLLTQELHLAKEQNKQIETQISFIRQKVTQSTRTKNELTQGKDTKAAMKSSFSQNLKEEETLIKRLSDENSRLEEDIENTRGSGENLTKTKAELEQKVNALNIQKGELEKGIQRAGESEKTRIPESSVTRCRRRVRGASAAAWVGEVDLVYLECELPSRFFFLIFVDGKCTEGRRKYDRRRRTHAPAPCLYKAAATSSLHSSRRSVRNFRNSRTLSFAPSKDMLGLALLSLCAVGWASAAPHDEDLRTSVVFNQLAIAQLLDNVSNISRVTTQLAQLSRSHTAQTQQLSEGSDVTPEQDESSPGTFIPSDFVEKVKARENKLQELLQMNNQTATVIQQLEEQSLQLQNEVDLRRQEAQQKEDSIGQLEASIRRVKDDTLQLLAKGSDTEAEKASLQAKTQALKDQVAAEKALRPQKQATKSQLDQQVAELESNSKEIRQQMARLDQELEQLEQRKATAEGEKRAQLGRNADLKEAKEDALAAETRIQTGIDQLTGRIRKIRSCTNISEALQARTGLNDNQIQEQQEASAQLEAKRKQMEERIRQAGTTKQQLQDQLLQLQTEELQLKNEEVQAKTENLEAKSALQKAEGEKAQLNNEISLLTQELHLAKEQNKQIETQISSARQKVTQSTRTKNELTQNRDTKAAMKSSLSQNLKEEETLIKRLSDENSRLEEDIERTRGTVANLTRAKAELEEKLNALNIQKEELKKGIQRAGESEKSVQASIARVSQEIQEIESEIEGMATQLGQC
ncbi:hypothetical protein C7M84_020207 [Penaeus vannamei]|uniref:Uncharacterized protein n=1 Tax=Penaeus vannamei TaxID=6689 RepID=A0A423SCS0_PENVA|nr:hypothetical protein C7M84_020207 [Penaeus vannamei]